MAPLTLAIACRMSASSTALSISVVSAKVRDGSAPPSLISKLRASNAQMVFPVSYLNDSLLIVRTMRQQKIDLPAIGGAAGDVIPDIVKGLGEFAEGVLRAIKDRDKGKMTELAVGERCGITLPTRMVFRESGFDVTASCRAALVESLTDDEETVSALMEIVNATFGR